MNSIDCSECISIEELRNENEEPLFYVALPKSVTQSFVIFGLIPMELYIHKAIKGYASED